MLGSELVASGSDDGFIRIWDLRVKRAVQRLENKYPCLSVCFARGESKTIFSGGLDNDVKIWDVKKGQVEEKLEGHLDTVTGISLSQNGHFLVSNASDQTLRVWDVRPFCEKERCVKILQGHGHGYDKSLLRVHWNQDHSMISAGSSDGILHIWDSASRNIVHSLEGHTGPLVESHFSPTDRLIVSCGLDQMIYVSKIPKYGLGVSHKLF
jgi:Prp8 binding protein